MEFLLKLFVIYESCKKKNNKKVSLYKEIAFRILKFKTRYFREFYLFSTFSIQMYFMFVKFKQKLFRSSEKNIIKRNSKITEK